MEPTSEQPFSSIGSLSERNPQPTSVRKSLSAFVLVIAVAVVAYMFTGGVRRPDATNLVGLVGSTVVEEVPLLQTSRPDEIEEALRDELGVRLFVPNIIGASILGVGLWDADRGARIPVVTYDDPNGDIRKVLLMNYAMLDRISEAVYLDRSTRLELEQDRSYAVVGASDNREIVIWRVGDDIFLAVAERGAGRLVSRIVQPGSGAQG